RLRARPRSPRGAPRRARRRARTRPRRSTRGPPLRSARRRSAGSPLRDDASTRRASLLDDPAAAAIDPPRAPARIQRVIPFLSPRVHAWLDETVAPTYLAIAWLLGLTGWPLAILLYCGAQHFTVTRITYYPRGTWPLI